MSEIHGAVGSYVVNALDGPELAEFESHLAVCATCQREVLEFSETAAQVGRLVETPPPPDLRDSIIAAIREVRPLPPQQQPPSAEPERPSRSASTEPEAQPAPVDDLTHRRQRRITRALTLAVAAALVVAVALGGWVYNLVQERQALVAATALETQLLSAPDAKVYTDTLADGTRVSFVVSKRLDKALFVGADLARPGPDQAYQLWTFDKKSRPIPDSVFDGGRNRKAWFSGKIGDAAALAVTIEPRTGSSRPSGDPIAYTPI